MTDKKTQLDRFAPEWKGVVIELEKRDVSAYKVAILEADKIFRTALSERNLPGKDTASQLEGNSRLFANYDKLRYGRAMHDKLVNKTGFVLGAEDAYDIIKGYHDAILDLENADTGRLPLSDRLNVFFERNFSDTPDKAKKLLLGLVLFSAITFILTETETGRSLTNSVTSANDYIYYRVIPIAVYILLISAIAVSLFYAYRSRTKK
jgi:hypothetical protein